MEDWSKKTDYDQFLAESPEIRSTLSVMPEGGHPLHRHDQEAQFVKDVSGILSQEEAAHDIASYKDAPPGFRIWCGHDRHPDDRKA